MENEIFNWTYADEQRAKKIHINSNKNPYEQLPQMRMMIIKIPEEIRSITKKGEHNEFDLNTFFKAKSKNVNKNKMESSFEHEDFVQKWLYLIKDQYILKQNKFDPHGTKPILPFADKNLVNYLKHTIWFLPDISSCWAMKKILGEKQNSFFHDYKIIVAAGTQAGIGLKALKNTEKKMGNPLETKSITLTCGKLMTGVTVPAWNGIFMLRNTKSPETYFQAAFRVQNPHTIKRKDVYAEDGFAREIIKPHCYIFDFDPNRALKLVVEIASKLSVDAENNKIELKVKDFLKFMPVIAIDGYDMEELNAPKLLDVFATGNSPSMLALRFKSNSLVCVDNFTLDKLQNEKELLDALEKIEKFRNIKESITKILSVERSIQKTTKERKKVTDKQKEEKKQQDGVRKQLRDNLKQINIRIPIFMYLTDYREETLNDVITKLEPKLFARVTGLQIKHFKKLKDIGVFHNANMNHVIFSFRKFEDSSLNYVGGKDPTKSFGGFEDTYIQREDLKNF